MVAGLFHIKLNTSEDNKDKGFFALMTSGASVVCLKDEEYIIDEKAKIILEAKNVKFELEQTKVVPIKTGIIQNATEIKI